MKYDEELKKNIKLDFCVAISEIHGVLAVLCEIDKVIALHACMPRSTGCGRTGSERANRNIPNVDIDSCMVSPDIDYAKWSILFLVSLSRILLKHSDFTAFF